MKDSICRILLVGLVRVITGARAIQNGDPPPGTQPRVYFANHGSHLDFVALWAALPPDERRRTRPVAAKDFWERTRLRRWIATGVFRALLIDRQTVTRSNNPLALMEQTLAAGESIIIFPEGTRSPDGTVGPFRPGLYHLMRRCPDAVFVPVHLQNLNRVLPRGEMLPIPLISTIVFGSPVSLREGESREGFLARARETVLSLGSPDRRPATAAPADS